MTLASYHGSLRLLALILKKLKLPDRVIVKVSVSRTLIQTRGGGECDRPGQKGRASHWGCQIYHIKV